MLVLEVEVEVERQEVLWGKWREECWNMMVGAVLKDQSSGIRPESRVAGLRYSHLLIAMIKYLPYFYCPARSIDKDP